MVSEIPGHSEGSGKRGQKRCLDIMDIIKSVKIRKIIGERSAFILGIDQRIVE